MKWDKLGVAFCPDGSMPWARTHAMLPTPFGVSDDRLRIYAGFCDDDGIARPGYVDVDPEDPMRVIDYSREPLFDVGVPGTFDENGALPCSVVRGDGDTVFMFYVGFELGTKIRYRLFTGLAVSHDGGSTFERIQRTPVLDRSDQELFFRCGPFCLRENGRYRLWYVAGSEWEDVNGKQSPVYDMRHQESDDPSRWGPVGRLVLPITGDDEHGFGRPYIMRNGDGYRMFYSIRRRSVGAYRLGYAESPDGIAWTRMDHKLNLDVSSSGFDSNAIMYAAPHQTRSGLYVFYNGNGFGADGIGVAKLAEA